MNHYGISLYSVISERAFRWDLVQVGEYRFPNPLPCIYKHINCFWY